MRKAAALVTGILLASLLVMAQAPGAPRAPQMQRWWANPMVVNQLGLSEAQIKQFDQLAVDTAMKLIDEKAVTQKQQVQLLALFIPDKLDEARFNQQVDAMLASETRMKKTLISAVLQGYNLLTPEQQKKAKMLMQNMEFMRHMGMGPGEPGEGRRPVAPPKPQ